MTFCFYLTLKKEYLYSKVHSDYGIYVGMKFIKLNAK